ncbi:MAG: hypothetical protein Cons2KO_10980 [Congregibacter sp.]
MQTPARGEGVTVQLILIRHGEPDLSNGADDPPLSQLGLQQARQSAELLSREPINRIVSSPLLRARQTAEPLAAALALPVELVDGVAEVDRWGASYISVEDLRREGGEAWAHFLRDPVGALGGDEAAFRRDVSATFRQLALEVDGRTAVATHGLPINLILAQLLNLDGLTNFSPHHASVTRLHIGDGGRMRVLSINESIHISREVD